ncbi:unnamed protein product [Prorocentrum cordatum]|uniref:Uncharacterized protein n=1 Tax=Prorocentrum cordatum TaxID=2364126 RepID=A0ABN9WH13_9DINO|nr:unnamed protein product [Polarella glacialis]
MASGPWLLWPRCLPATPFRCYINDPLCRALSRAMARVLAVMLMALAFVQASALDSEEDRPKGARRRQMERTRAAELEAAIAKSGCADLGGEKWFADAHGELFQVKQDKCSISFQLKKKSGEMYEKKGVVRGTRVLVEPPFPEGQMLPNQTVMWESGARWERKW